MFSSPPTELIFLKQGEACKGKFYADKTVRCVRKFLDIKNKMKLFSDPRAVLAQRGARLCEVLVSAESDALQDHCLMMQKNLRLERETYPWGKKTDLKKMMNEAFSPSNV